MIYQGARILRDVRRILDENSSGADLLLENDRETLDLDSLILSKAEEGAEHALLVAHPSYLEGGHQLPDEIYKMEGGGGMLPLPDDFLRLREIRLKSWERTLHSAIAENDPRYAMQSSRFSGIKGNVQKPVCALAGRSTGIVLELYPYGGVGDTLVHGDYIPRPRFDRDGGIDISKKCYRGSLYITAGLVALTYGEGERADRLTATGEKMLGR